MYVHAHHPTGSWFPSSRLPQSADVTSAVLYVWAEVPVQSSPFKSACFWIGQVQLVIPSLCKHPGQKLYRPCLKRDRLSGKHKRQWCFSSSPQTLNHGGHFTSGLGRCCCTAAAITPYFYVTVVRSWTKIKPKVTQKTKKLEQQKTGWYCMR